MAFAGSGTTAADWPARARWLEIQVESRQYLQHVLTGVYSEILRLSDDGREHRCKGKNATLTRTRLYEPNITINPLMYRKLCYTWL
ncbi:hypothetical protein ALC56_09652 [Trachymyrmex septentrionalis]|uniref:Uncharacterized protein n=1 Tax=Trachymyrmex septentrionalis TaxID=34720 RepID=A0A195F649_9HYME|nr:hypothetical protein ALC56_09652 [Trachymyrmex septentrionalis]